MTKQLTFDIDGMTCGGCAARAQKALQAVAGVTEAQVNLATKTGRVTLADASEPGRAEALLRALGAAGYPALLERVEVEIEGMSCAGCAAKIERALLAHLGVVAAKVNFSTQTARLEGFNLQSVPARISELGYEAHLKAKDAPARQESVTTLLKTRFLWAAVFTLPLFILEMGGHLVPAWHHWLYSMLPQRSLWGAQALLTAAVLFGPGREILQRGARSLWYRAPDMNALVLLGAGTAFLYSVVVLLWGEALPEAGRHVYFEAAAVIVTLILAGRWLEARAKGQTGEAIRKLLSLRPTTALRVAADGGQEKVPLAQIRRGDVLIVRAGERIALDGVLKAGVSHIDESMLTGEPIPVRKEKGARVTGGTLNGEGTLEVRVTATGEETVLARIVALVEEAQGARLPVQDRVTAITLWFVPAMIGLAVLTFGLWAVFGPAPRLTEAMIAAVTVLIVACPCAMGLAVPVSIMVGTGRAAELGVLFRKGDALQRLAEVEIFAFDKTGTLTEGRPSLTRFTGTAEVFQAAASLEAYSDHPTARALAAAAKAQAVPLLPVAQMRTVAGEGVCGEVETRLVVVGNRTFLERQGITPVGQGPVYVAIDGVCAGDFAVEDTLKSDARDVIEALQRKGKRVVMLSGDAQGPAQNIAAALGITEVQAQMRPEAKLAAIEALKTQGVTAFVGDGINDAAALAAADVGLAIGAGTDVAIESADVVLMGRQLRGVLAGYEVSRATLANIRQNLVWAFGYNILLLPVAMGLLYPLWGLRMAPALAAAAMALSSLFVLGNALRLRGHK